MGATIMQHPSMWTWLLWTVLVSTTMSHRSERVIQGSDAAQGDYPWIAYIRNDYTACGATIISESWMVSAAHCFGTRLVLKPEQGERMWRFGFKRIIRHPRYKTNSDEYDIALIEIDGKFPLSERKVSIANLPTGLTTNQWPPIDSFCTFVGWGCLRKNGPTPKIAQEVSLKVFSNAVCSRYYGDLIGLDAGQEFCAGYYGRGVGLCPGDSGSGLIQEYDGQPVLVGVVSTGNGANPESYPAVFTRVSVFTDWILGTIEGMR